MSSMDLFLKRGDSVRYGDQEVIFLRWEGRFAIVSTGDFGLCLKVMRSEISPVKEDTVYLNDDNLLSVVGQALQPKKGSKSS